MKLFADECIYLDGHYQPSPARLKTSEVSKTLETSEVFRGSIRG